MSDDQGDTLQLTAKLLPVAREIHARPGDRLVVVAGVVIAVHTGTAAPPKAAALATPTARPPRPKPMPPSPLKGQTKAQATGRVSEWREQIRAAVLHALQTTGRALTARDTSQLRPPEAPTYLVSDTLRQMAERGELVLGGSTGPNRSYSLPAPTAEAAA